MRILIVDDDVDLAHATAFMLRDLGYDVQFAINGRGALTAAARFLPEVVLLDLSLPDMDGCHIAERLRSQPGMSATRIVAVTGLGEQHRRRALEAGCDAFVVKPIDPERLRDVLGS